MVSEWPKHVGAEKNNKVYMCLAIASVVIAYMNEIQINAWCGTYETTQCVHCEVGRETLRIFLDQL